MLRPIVQRIAHRSGTRSASVSTFFKTLKEKINEGFEKDEHLKESIEETKRITKESEVTKTAAKAAEKAAEGAEIATEVAVKGAKATASTIKATASVTASVTHKAAEVTGAKAAARAAGRGITAVSQSHVVKSTGEALSKSAATLSETAAAQKIKKVTVDAAQEVFEDTPYEELVGSRKSDIGKRKKVVLNTEVTALAEGKGKRFEQGVLSKAFGKISEISANNPVVRIAKKKGREFLDADGKASEIAREAVGRIQEAKEDAREKAKEWSDFIMPETENGKALATIRMYDPLFEPFEFVRWCKTELIPTVLDAMKVRDEETIEALCGEKVIAMLSSMWAATDQAGGTDMTHYYDVRNVEFLNAALKENGEPTVLIMFKSSSHSYVVDKKGNVISGDPDTILNVTSVWSIAVDTSGDVVKWRVDEFNNHGVVGLI